MAGYIYIASNKSMVGLVKVGRTNKSPSARMAELNTTGVPTPFKLEFVARVEDSTRAERLLHDALRSCRVDRGREFFRTDARTAIEHALKYVGPLVVVWDHTPRALGIPELVADYDRVKREHAAQQQKEREARVAVVTSKIDAVRNQLASNDKRLSELGEKPAQPNLERSFLSAGSWGWVFWLGILMVFSKENWAIGLISGTLAAVSYLLYHAENSRRKAYEEQVAPWWVAEREQVTLNTELAKLGRQMEAAEKLWPREWRQRPESGRRSRWRRY